MLETIGMVVLAAVVFAVTLGMTSFVMMVIIMKWLTSKSAKRWLKNYMNSIMTLGEEL